MRVLFENVSDPVSRFVANVATTFGTRRNSKLWASFSPRYGMFACAMAIVLISSGSLASRAQDDWVEQSNTNAEPILRVFAKYSPEGAGRYGLDGYDEAILDLRENVYERSRKDIREVLTQLKKRLPDEKHPKVWQDLEILIQVLTDNLARGERRRRFLLPYIDVSQIVFESTRTLLNDNVAESRYPAAAVRLKKYAGMEDGTAPLTELAKQRISELFGVEGLTGPYRVAVRKSLAKSDTLVEGIADLMRKRGLKDWETAHKQFAAQVKSYNKWIETELLPKGRDDNRLPEELYLDRLQAWGIRTTPQDLIERGQFGFMEIRAEMAALAKQIAAKRGWEKNGYRDVIAALKREQLDEDEILPIYRQRLKDIEEIIRREKIVTLPNREARIRFATAAESAVQSAPNMQAPRLIGNTGEYGAFLIPLRNPDAETGDKMDDFLHDSVAWTLTAHEARPGHEMQFSAMIENGVSITRAVFAWNSANTEGWGLYSEAIMKEHLPLEGQFFTLYMRLLRAARSFLDPMVNLGQMRPNEAKAFLMRELMLSEPMATQEADRYSFRLPGQAPSYYYGLMKLQALRTKAELQLNADFDQQAFHDFILAQGLLPLELLEKAVLEEFVPAARVRAAQVGKRDVDFEQVKSILSKEINEVLDDTGVPSISIALIKDGRVAWTEAFGHANLKFKSRATADTIYSTGSCFKPITAMAVMQLVDKGRVQLDDPVNKYLRAHAIKDMTADGRPVTVRHLLAHYSGLKSPVEVGRSNGTWIPLWSREAPQSLREMAADLEPKFMPGEEYRYSNFAYALAGLLVEEVSGQSFEQYVVENIFKPLGIAETGPVNPTPEMLERFAFPYRMERNKAVPERQLRFEAYPAGDIYLSVPSMAKILATHLNGGKHDDVSILSEKSVKEMHTRQFGGKDGLDFGIREHQGETLIMHGGGVWGYSTKFILCLESKVGVYLAANSTQVRLPVQLLAQMSMDLLRGKQIGKGLVRVVNHYGIHFVQNQETKMWQIGGTWPKSPASRAGLSLGLRILKINDVAIQGESLQSILRHTRGPLGTKVRFELLDPTKNVSKTVELTQQTYMMPG